MFKRFGIIIVALALLGLGAIWDLQIAANAVELASSSLLQLLLILPPIFILMGLLDVWVPRETMAKFLGSESNLLGAAIAFFLGSAAAGPLYVAFPIAAMLVKKGASLTNVFIFIGAWSTTKIPLLMFEYSAMGPRFTLARLLINIPVIIFIAFSMHLFLGKEEKQSLQDRAEKMMEIE